MQPLAIAGLLSAVHLREQSVDPIQEAAALLARARAGEAIAGLPKGLRPRSLEQAEAVQHATLAALGQSCGGWKVGRHGDYVFSAPIPASHLLVQPGSDAVSFRAERFIELELALRFRVAVSAADVTTLVPGDLTGLATLATLLEFVRPRYLPTAETAPLDRIADCLSNEGAMVRSTLLPWRLEDLDTPPAVTLFQDGAVLSRHEGPHVGAPVLPLLEAWIARLRRERRGIAAGEVVTLGSLSGMPPIPAQGAQYLGEVGELEPLRCRVAPV